VTAPPRPADALALDHVIIAGPELDMLRSLVEERTGVRPIPGGVHPGHGTHNALVGLGQERYLELLAPDPEQGGGAFADTIAHLLEGALHTWCVRAGDADAAARRVLEAGATPRRLPMSRRRPDGSELAWELVFVDHHPFGSLVPFFVDWRGAAHPARSLRDDLSLQRLELRHPDADGLRAFLERLGGVPEPVVVAPGDTPRIGATLLGDGRRWSVDGAG
jgi:hypothetical protein